MYVCCVYCMCACPHMSECKRATSAVVLLRLRLVTFLEDRAHWSRACRLGWVCPLGWIRRSGWVRQWPCGSASTVITNAGHSNWALLMWVQGVKIKSSCLHGHLECTGLSPWLLLLSWFSGGYSRIASLLCSVMVDHAPAWQPGSCLCPACLLPICLPLVWGTMTFSRGNFPPTLRLPRVYSRPVCQF